MVDVLLDRLIDCCVTTIDEHAQELTQLDQAIGDGDHGINMKRGFDAIAGLRDEITKLDFGEALHKAGMTLVMKVGGASGPLYGSLFMGMGKASTSRPSSYEEAKTILWNGIEMVQKRGKSDVGQKTMLDVLVPTAEAFDKRDIVQIRVAADEGLESTRDMLALKGRAAFLGERSIGHLDPGARSSHLLIHAICDVIESQ